MSAEPVLVPRPCQLPVEEPLQIQCDHAAARVIDASLLLVLDGLPGRTHMSIYIKNGRDLARKPRRLVKNRDRLETRYDLVTNFSETITEWGLFRSQVLPAKRRLDPLSRPSMKDYLLE